jgi:hypothetical protein
MTRGSVVFVCTRNLPFHNGRNKIGWVLDINFSIVPNVVSRVTPNVLRYRTNWRDNFDFPIIWLPAFTGSLRYWWEIYFYVGFEVFTAVVMKSIIFWDMTPCSLLATCLLAGSCLNYFFDPEDGGAILLRNVGCNSTDYTASYPERWYSSIYF